MNIKNLIYKKKKPSSRSNYYELLEFKNKNNIIYGQGKISFKYSIVRFTPLCR